MTTPDLEAAARAIYEKWQTDWEEKIGDTTDEWEVLPTWAHQHWYSLARACLSAIRVPSVEVIQTMTSAIVNSDGEYAFDDAEVAFTAGIDAILADKTGGE